MRRINAKAFHAFMGLGLLGCAICPVIEFLCRSNDCIFQTGHDTETTLALLFILIELAVASLKLVVPAVARVLSFLDNLKVVQISFVGAALSFAVPTLSPPLLLRI